MLPLLAAIVSTFEEGGWRSQVDSDMLLNGRYTTYKC